MKFKFIVSLIISFSFLAFFSDLSYIHSIIKIPIRLMTIILMIIPIYLVIYKKVDIVEILFKNKSDKKLFFQSIIIATVLILFASIIRLSTYEKSIITFERSLHYGDYLYLYLTFGYLVQVFFQDMLLILLYKGLTLFVLNRQWSFIVVTLLFGISHLFLNIFSAILTFLAGVIFLWIYKRFENILAVTIVHYLVGVVAIAFGWT